MSRINETTDKYATQKPNTADGWAAQLAADRNNYQKGTHENLYGHDLAAAQSFVQHQFGQLQITGTQDGHLVGLDRNSKNYVSLLNGKETAIGGLDNQWAQTATGHQAKFSPDGSGLYQVGGQDRSGEDVAKSILKDRGMLGLNNGDPSATQIANFQRDMLLANGRKVNDLNWFRHLQPGQVIKVPAGEQALQQDAPFAQGATGQLPTFGPQAAAPAPYEAAAPAPYQAAALAPYEAAAAAPYQAAAPAPYEAPAAAPYEPAAAPAPYEAAPALTPPPLPQIPTDPASTKEIRTEAAVVQRNNDLDVAYQYATQLYGKETPINLNLINAALKNTDLTQLTPSELRGLKDIQENFAKMGSYAPYNALDVLTKDGISKFEKQQEADTWFQAAKDSPELGAEMANAAKAFKKFSKSSALLGLIGGHQFLMKDDIPDLINKHTDPQSVQGLKFLQRHYDELVQGDEKSGILLEEIESWRKR